MPDNPVVDQGDVQGLILRGYHMRCVRHFTLRITNPANARDLIKNNLYRITTAEEDNNDPVPCLNIAFTFEGLKKIGQNQRCREIEDDPTFKAFVEGALKRAKEMGDIGPGDPEEWRNGRGRWYFDVLLSVYTKDKGSLDQFSVSLQRAFDGAFEELGPQDPLEGAALGKSDKDDHIHFGFKDGIAQPIISGVPVRTRDDGSQHDSPPGAFLLGYPSQWKDYSYPPFNEEPPEEEPDAARALRLTSEHFWRNGSFLAFRVLKQDVKAFEAFLTRESERTGLNRELIAAKMCGRWRNGYPLELAPTADSTVADAQLNNFDYSGDSKGLRCPFGAHIRRANPRDDAIASNTGTKHRLIRRGMPYGPEYDPRNPDDQQERGLLGMFICANLQDQYEFVMKNWINKSGFNGNLAPNHRDPLIGWNNSSREFLIPRWDGETTLELSQFVTTRGGAYCFIPSMTALRYIAGVGTGEEHTAAYRDGKEKRLIDLIDEEMVTISSEMEKIDKKEMEKRAAIDKAALLEPVGMPVHRYQGKRMVHPKSHGSVMGIFKVADDLAPDLHTELFQPKAQYEAYIRFSNADMVELDDTKPDLRGMAIKLLDVDKKGKEQDFVLVSHEQFFSRDAKDFLALITAIRKMFETAAKNGSYLTGEEFQRGIFPYLAHRPMQREIFKEMQSVMNNPLNHPYYSQVPFKFGNGMAAKYRVEPRQEFLEIVAPKPNNRLQYALTESLRDQAAVFEFGAQFQTDPAAMPIEDAMAEWDRNLSEFVPLGTLAIHAQPVTNNFDQLSFTPWHAVDDHLPLGGINRVRGIIYKLAADRRRGVPVPPKVKQAKAPAGVYK